MSADLEQLVQRTVAGDSDAWRELLAALNPMLEAIARSHPQLRGKGLAALPDDVAAVKLATIERFAASDFQNLKRFLDRAAATGEPGQKHGFDSWVYGAVDFVVREHLRRRFGRAPAPAGDAVKPLKLSKRELNSQAARLDDVPVERSFLTTMGMTARMTLAQIFEHIEHDFDPNEVRAMRLYYNEDFDFADIASALGLSDGKSAERMIRRLNARLRYRFMPAAK